MNITKTALKLKKGGITRRYPIYSWNTWTIAHRHCEKSSVIEYGYY